MCHAEFLCYLYQQFRCYTIVTFSFPPTVIILCNFRTIFFIFYFFFIFICITKYCCSFIIKIKCTNLFSDNFLKKKIIVRSTQLLLGLWIKTCEILFVNIQVYKSYKISSFILPIMSTSIPNLFFVISTKTLHCLSSFVRLEQISGSFWGFLVPALGRDAIKQTDF